MNLLKKFQHIALCSAMALGTISVIATVEADATTTVKLYKGKLVYTKTLKPVSKKTVYKNKLYIKGGKLATGTVIFQKKQYVKGIYKPDHKKPVFSTPKGFKTSYTLLNGQSFKVPTLTAKDNVSGVVKVTRVIQDSKKKTLKTIDTKKAGTYSITYTTKDAAGNKATKSVKVVVGEKKSVQLKESVVAMEPGTLRKIQLQEVGETYKKDLSLPNKQITFLSYSDFVTVDADGTIHVSKFASTGHKGKIQATYVIDGKQVKTTFTVQVKDIGTNNDAVQMLHYGTNYEVVNISKTTQSIQIPPHAAVVIYNGNDTIRSEHFFYDDTNLTLNAKSHAVISYEQENVAAPAPTNEASVYISKIEEEAFTVAKVRENGSVHYENEGGKGLGSINIIDSNKTAHVNYANYLLEQSASFGVDEIVDKQISLDLYNGCQAVVTNTGGGELITYAVSPGVHTETTTEQAVSQATIHPGDFGIIRTNEQKYYGNKILLTSSNGNGQYDEVTYEYGDLSDFKMTNTIKSYQERNMQQSAFETKMFQNTGDFDLVVYYATETALFEAVPAEQKEQVEVSALELAPGEKVEINASAPNQRLTVQHNKSAYTWTTINEEPITKKGPMNKVKNYDNLVLLPVYKYMLENTGTKKIRLLKTGNQMTVTRVQ